MSASTTGSPETAALEQQILGLYSNHHGWLHGWLRKKLGCTHRAADLAHDTFVRLLTSSIPTRLDEPRAYLTTVARHVLLNHQRRQRLEQAWATELALMPQGFAPSAEERVMLLETLLAIDALLDGLPAKTRQAFLLSQLDGLTYAEIAAEIGVSVSRVRQYMTSALTHCYAAL